MDKVEIRTAAGACPSYLFHPAGGGPWPAVLMYMDGVGIRPAMLEVGERLASYGYLVLLCFLATITGHAKVRLIGGSSLSLMTTVVLVTVKRVVVPCEFRTS